MRADAHLTIFGHGQESSNRKSLPDSDRNGRSPLQTPNVVLTSGLFRAAARVDDEEGRDDAFVERVEGLIEWDVLRERELDRVLRHALNVARIVAHARLAVCVEAERLRHAQPAV